MGSRGSPEHPGRDHGLRAGRVGRHRVRAAARAGQSLGEVESTKSVSEIYAPLSGTVTARNDKLGDEPELINSDPYGDGWLVEIEPADPDALEDLLDAQAYEELVSTE